MTLRRSTWVRTYPVRTFYFLAFTISWVGWVPSLATSWGVPGFSNPLWTVFLVLPAIGPALAAKFTNDWQGYPPVSLNSLFRWPVAPQWYVLAVGLPLSVLWVANSLSHWLSTTSASSPVRGKSLAVFCLLSCLVNPWEEVGWRGFALKRLQARHSVFTASLLVGSLWGIWHMPLFFVNQGPISMTMTPFWPWFIGILGWSFVMTWLYNGTAHNLLICSVCHVASNGFGALLGIDSYWALAVTKVSLALVVWLIYGSELTAVPTRDGDAEKDF